MIAADDYKEYFGVDTAPTNLIRLEYISLQVFKTIMTSDIPTSTDAIYDDFKNALMEQIKFFDENDDLTSIVGNGYTLGKFSEGTNEKIESNQINKRISPIAYSILLNCGLLYAGLCS